ncbi:hypothetical protein ACFQ5J_10225 [Lacticaseibacillus baoqingensis]|uniref:Uncharacterized protein n=1 Tax=Lacticaseibacillus baoqingensis TaxID=2486013 RepID=A0ABW4EAJ3_9LACO|nr:hypothetical protein [Lacticaseibacillus baoqingensis]
MYYFLNNFVPNLCSGIEHAEFKRLALFKAHHVPAKIVTAAYTRDAADNLARYHIDVQDYVNLYDYFCDNVGLPQEPLTVDDLILPSGVNVVTDGDVTKVLVGQWTCEVIHSKAGRIDYSEHFDGDGQLVRRDYYDTRGFLGFSQYFATTDDAQTGHLALETF